MPEWIADLIDALREPLVAFASPHKRVYWPFLASALALAIGFWVVRERRRVGLLSYLFPRAVWWHASARLDYKLLFARAVVRALIFAPLAISATTLAVELATIIRLRVGMAPTSTVPASVVVPSFTVTLFLADDLGRFALHRLMHRVPALWELHKVHHSAEVLTPLSLYRVHPIEAWLNTLRGALTLGVVAGVFVWAFPGRVRAWEVLGVDAIGFVFATLGANLRHSHVRLAFGPVLERLFVSPAQHQIHHSDLREHHDKNFGSALSIWDWMSGSLLIARGDEPLKLGLSSDQKNHRDTVVGVLVDPVAAAARALIAPLRAR
ncbi:MAG: sterol desaturase family protein [Deltaproteobacteria bacterium]|nr:sterol desaturase family protein [Deltaproteobacteria bacterium]